MKKLLLILPLLIFSCKTRNAVEQKTITPPKVKIDTSTKDFFDEIAKHSVCFNIFLYVFHQFYIIILYN